MGKIREYEYDEKGRIKRIIEYDTDGVTYPTYPYPQTIPQPIWYYDPWQMPQIMCVTSDTTGDLRW